MPTRPTISWSDLGGSASVGLWGLGVEGRANLARLEALGTTPVLVDDRPAIGELDGLAVLATTQGGLSALEHCDVVVKTPGISRDPSRGGRPRGRRGGRRRRPRACGSKRPISTG